MTYKLMKFGVQRISDGALIPLDTDNMDWVRYQEWLAAGNTPQAADPEPAPLPPQPTLADVIVVLSTTQKAALDAAVASKVTE